MDKFFKSQTEVSDNFFDEKGIGEIKNSKVFYKGTYWEIDSNLDAKYKSLYSYQNERWIVYMSLSNL